MSMTRGRPRQFDESAALQKAMDVFWEHGFEGTSYEDLVTGMDMSRSSIYGCFGDKETLFEQAFGRYCDTVLHEFRQELETPKEGISMLDTIKNIVRSSAKPLGEGHRGCLITKTVMNASELGGPANRLVVGAVSQMRDTFEKMLREARKKNEVSVSCDVEAMAAVLVVQFYGNAILARLGGPEDILQDAVEGTESLLR